MRSIDKLKGAGMLSFWAPLFAMRENTHHVGTNINLVQRARSSRFWWVELFNSVPLG